MSTIPASSNPPESTHQPSTNHQSAAMRAALLVRCQYSSESKILFRRECINHLKASLAPGQGASA